jgi:hypothetical protein
VSDRAGRVLVIGAGGAVGGAVAAAFASAGWNTLRAGRGPDADVRVDLDDPRTLAYAMERVDLAVNAVPHPDLAAERLVLTEGGLLINVADRSPAERRALRGIPDPAGRVLLNWGVIPGLSALVAAHLLRREPEADEIELAVTFGALATSGTAGGDFLHRELTGRSRHATATIPFPAPVGPRRCIGMAEDQEGWMGSAADGRPVRSYVCLTEPGMTPALLAVNRLGLMRALPRAAFQIGRGRTQRDLSREHWCVWVAVRRAGERLRAVALQGAGMYRCTALATVAAAEALRSGDASPGCFDPNELLELESVGLTVRPR